MKISIIITSLILLAGSAVAQHDHGAGHTNAPRHSKKETAHSHRAVPEFQMQLHDVFVASLQLKDALILSDAAKATESVSQIRVALSKVDLALLKDEALMDWMGSLKILNENLERIGSSTDLTIQRQAFSSFSNGLYKSLKEFGAGGIIVYYVQCPMANDNAGAYWLSDTKEIRNPYLGNEMLTCGKVKETIQ
jgi:Cu(I)/Ag(I) efflux system membrane fusion protein